MRTTFTWVTYQRNASAGVIFSPWTYRTNAKRNTFSLNNIFGQMYENLLFKQVPVKKKKNNNRYNNNK